MHKGAKHSTMIPAGAILEIAPTRSAVGVVTASCGGRMLWVFLHDLLEAGAVEPSDHVG